MIFEYFKTNKKFMKKILITFFITISLILVSWKYNEVKFDDPNKDKLLIELLKYVAFALLGLKMLSQAS